MQNSETSKGDELISETCEDIKLNRPLPKDIITSLAEDAERQQTGAYIGKVLQEGGVLMVGDKPVYVTPAPKWVFYLLSRGIGVRIGAWCVKETAETQETLEKLYEYRPGQ